MNVWLHAISRLWHCVRMMWSCRKHKENMIFSFLLLCMSLKVSVRLNQCLCILISLHCREIYMFLGVLCEGGKWKYKCKCENNELEEHIYWRMIIWWKQVYNALKGICFLSCLLLTAAGEVQQICIWLSWVWLPCNLLKTMKRIFMLGCL